MALRLGYLMLALGYHPTREDQIKRGPSIQYLLATDWRAAILALIIDIDDPGHVQRIADFIYDLGCRAVLVKDTQVSALPSQQDHAQIG